MSHTATCERDGHVDPPSAVGGGHAVEGDHGSPGSRVPDGRGPTVVGRARRVVAYLTLPELRWAALSLLAFLLALLVVGVGGPAGVSWALFGACYLSGGWEPGLAGLRALRGRTLDVDILMVVAALIAAGIGQVLDGALLIVIFATSGALEAVATKRTRDSVRSLLSLAPEQATRLLPDGGEETVDTATLTVADQILIRPGERIGADGRVLDGASEVDQATITGEPLPVSKTAGDEVFAGTLNGTGALRVRVERAAADTVVARIVALVEAASATKAQTQLFIDTVEQRYSVGLVVATLALFLVPLAFGGELQSTLLRAMTFMIVASPCAVVLATMPPLLSAIASAGRHGVLVKSAVVMEQLGHTAVVAFDKTGTLTAGTPRVAEVLPLAGGGMTEAQLLAVAAGAERPSEHPLAGAVVRAALDRGLSIPAATGFASAPGRGVTATVDGRRVAVGSPLLLTAAGPGDPRTAAAVARLQDAGRTAVIVTVDDQPVGVLGLADRLRPAAADAVAQLTALTRVPPVLLTGDNAAAARRLGGEVGIADVRSELLPADKVAAVHQLQAGRAHVTLVGDGINDAPALAAADTGIAMGRHGSDLALHSADIVLVRDELPALPAVLDISRRARRIITQNLIFAGAVITSLVAIDLTGHLPLPLGVAGHEGSTVIVGLNGLRLLSHRAWQVTGTRPPRRHSLRQTPRTPAETR